METQRQRVRQPARERLRHRRDDDRQQQDEFVGLQRPRREERRPEVVGRHHRRRVTLELLEHGPAIQHGAGNRVPLLPLQRVVASQPRDPVTAGPVAYQYAELTVFDKTSETIPKHFLNAALGLRQPWGSLNVYSNFSQQLNHMDRYRASVFGDTNVRIFKGFSFNMFAQYNGSSDQISLRKGAATETEVLLRLQQLQTNYSYTMFFGVSYSFGSIFNSVVNPRFSFETRREGREGWLLASGFFSSQFTSPASL